MNIISTLTRTINNAAQIVGQTIRRDPAILGVAVAAILAVAHVYALIKPKESLEFWGEVITLANLGTTTNGNVIDLRDSHLKELPSLSDYTQLKALNVGINELTSLPDLSPNRKLSELVANRNQLKSLPDLSANTQLEILDVSYNELTSLPDFSANTELATLDVNGNQLKSVPDLRANTQLVQVNLSNNLLTTLPDSILSLSRDCTVVAENNRFPEDHVAQFQARLAAHRLANPDQGPKVLMSSPLMRSPKLVPTLWSPPIKKQMGIKRAPPSIAHSSSE